MRGLRDDLPDGDDFSLMVLRWQGKALRMGVLRAFFEEGFLCSAASQGGYQGMKNNPIYERAALMTTKARFSPEVKFVWECPPAPIV